MEERKPYEKPQVTKIPIRPQESLLDNCKQLDDIACQGLLDFGS